MRKSSVDILINLLKILLIDGGILLVSLCKVFMSPVKVSQFSKGQVPHAKVVNEGHLLEDLSREQLPEPDLGGAADLVADFLGGAAVAAILAFEGKSGDFAFFFEGGLAGGSSGHQVDGLNGNVAEVDGLGLVEFEDGDDLAFLRDARTGFEGLVGKVVLFLGCG